MKKMTCKLTLLRYAALAAAIAACLPACVFQQNPPVFGIRIGNIKDADKQFAEYEGGNGDSPEHPMDVFVFFDLGDLSKVDNNYIQLLKIIGKHKKYVRLILTGQNMPEEFTSYPFAEAVNGMDRIVRFEMAHYVKSIKADENGRSPFFFYKNLKVVVLRVLNPNSAQVR